jgi:hypothetical protein
MYSPHVRHAPDELRRADRPSPKPRRRHRHAKLTQHAIKPPDVRRDPTPNRSGATGCHPATNVRWRRCVRVG